MSNSLRYCFGSGSGSENFIFNGSFPVEQTLFVEVQSWFDFKQNN